MGQGSPLGQEGVPGLPGQGCGRLLRGGHLFLGPAPSRLLENTGQGRSHRAAGQEAWLGAVTAVT